MAFVNTRPGEYNSAGGDPVEFNLEKFSGMTLNLLDHRLIVLDTMMVRQTMAGTKAAVFPTYGDANATHHAAGEDLLTGTAPETGNYLSEIPVGEHIIYADRKVQSSIFLDDLDQILNHWQHRQAFAKKLSTAVAEKVEDKLFRTIVKGSGLGASTVEGKSITGWPVVADASRAVDNLGAIDAQDVYDNCWTFATNLATENFDAEGRFAAVTTSLYYSLLRLSNTTGGVITEVVHKDYADGSVSLERPPLRGIWIAGIFVMPTNGIPTANTGYSGTEWRIGASADNNYDDVDMSKGIGMVGWTSEAVGTAIAASPVLDVNYIPERLGHLIVLHQSMGHGVLRPEGCFSLRATT